MISSATILRRTATVFLFATFFAGIGEASVSVKVVSMDEGLAESNISKPRIYIQNTGTETIDNFYYRYYFETEDNKPPLLEEYYTPNTTVLVASNGTGYYLQYNVIDANLTPGGLLPHSDGNVVGIHYADWSDWDNGNDFSNNQSSSFQENPNIAVFYNSVRIYGNEPGGIAGSVLKEVWTGISGTSTDSITLNATPWLTSSQENLDGPNNIADNYGVRLRGYITAPATGNYTFWLASDDNAKFFLSSDHDPDNKTLVASVSSWTGYRSWYEYPSQQSGPQALVAGNRYYIEILHKEGEGGDHCSVGWLTPGQSGTPQIVSGTVLTPYVPEIIPAVPTLSATVQSSNIISLTWNNVTNELGYKLEMATGSGPYSQLVTLTADNTSYQATGLDPETGYRFKIRSYNATGESDYSGEVEVTTFAVVEGRRHGRYGTTSPERRYPIFRLKIRQTRSKTSFSSKHRRTSQNITASVYVDT